MKGVTYLTDSKKKTVAVQIEIKTIERHQEELEDLLDVIVAESRKNEPRKSWEEVKKSLRKKGKL